MQLLGDMANVTQKRKVLLKNVPPTKYKKGKPDNRVSSHILAILYYICI